jgi:DNA-binding MarR family transcriptional regulator
MTGQVLSEQSTAVTAFARLLHAHASLTRRLSAQLEAEHGLTISDYEVLLRLSRAPERRLKRCELAESVLLTPSGITRLLDGLEATGLVGRAQCEGDRRVTYAVLTDEGEETFRRVSSEHLAAIEAAFGERLDREETGRLAGLLGRLSGTGDDAVCSSAG